MSSPQIRWNTTQDFSPGFHFKADPTQIKPGALIVGSKNVVINDGDRVSPREGTTRLGASSSATTPIKSLHTFRKRDGTEIMLRPYGTVLEYYHPTTAAWENLYSGYTTGQIFGFADHNINTDAEDFAYFCNAVEPYSRWTGAYDTLSGTYAGSETTITIVGDHFKTPVFFSGTASSVTTTTITIATASWATDIWNNFYVHITSGAQAGKISKISATTSTEITFATISSLSGTPTFEIRQLKWDDSDKSLRVGTTTVTYTGYGSKTTFTGASNMPAASANAAVCQSIKEYPANPRGNILRVLHTRMMVAGVKAKQGKGQESSIHYSKIANATDFSFSSPRVADEGGIADFPEGGGPITGLEIQEDTVYVFKEDSVHTFEFTTSGTAAELDLPQIRPLLSSPRGGAVTSLGVVKADNEIIYVSPEKGIKSVKRPEVVDFASPTQLSDPIVLFLDDVETDLAAGKFYNRKAYFAVRTTESSQNDTLLVFNFQKRAWEAPHTIPASCFTIYDGKLYYGSSTNPEVYQMEDGTTDDNSNPYEAIARFAYSNFGAAENPKTFETIFLEGYIGETTTITIKARYDYIGATETKTTTFSGTEEDYIVGDPAFSALGVSELGSEPLAGVSDDDDAPNDLPKFRVYFQSPKTPFYELSVEISSNQEGAQWEILRFGVDAQLMPNPVTSLRKALK